jgi:quinoprotein glucose dehydrogenase
MAANPDTRRPGRRPSATRLLPWVAAISLVALALRSRLNPGDGADWPEYSGGPDRDHYSALAQINTGNVARLRKVWEYHTGAPGEMQCNPIVVHGVLYGLTATNGVFALDAATGRERWRYAPPGVNSDHVVRGLTYWSDGSDRRILFTWNSFLSALDADTGRLITSFGDGGKASMKAGLGERAPDKWVVSTTPGTLFEDLIYMPTRVTETADAAMGFIQAFSVRTGKLVWTFHTIPSPGQFGYETWSKDAYKNINVGSANCWTGMSVDRARAILYVPTGSASPDFWGGDRIGKDLFANCLLALDARTGKLLWYHQIVHHDMWDRDLPAPPSLVTVRHDGRRVDAVAVTTKSGFVWVFDRVTGESLFPYKEFPAIKSELPGEQTWPTQPLPTWPLPFARQTLTEDDISPYAENRAELLAKFRQARRARFQPFGKYDTLLFPGFDGGSEWGGGAVDPDGVLYVNANEVAWFGRLKDAPRPTDLSKLSPGARAYATYCISCHGADRAGNPASGFPSLVDIGHRLRRDEIAQQIISGKGKMPGFPMIADRDRQALVDSLLGIEKASAAPQSAGPEVESADDFQPYALEGYVKFLDSNGYPAISPPWGSLTAIDLNSGEHLWRITLGEFKELTAKGIPPTGTENYGGPVVTAGGVLFIAATKDGMFRAFDKTNGKLIWQTELPAAGFATPCTYEVAGKQYVAIACGGTKLGTRSGDSYVAFALP